MAFSWRVAGPLVKSVSPITRSPFVQSTTTKLSDETDRRLTASAGYDSFVQFHWPSARCTKPSSDEHGQDRLKIDLATELLVVPERQFEGAALHVVEQNVQVVGIDERVLRRRVEEI